MARNPHPGEAAAGPDPSSKRPNHRESAALDAVGEQGSGHGPNAPDPAATLEDDVAPEASVGKAAEATGEERWTAARESALSVKQDSEPASIARHGAGRSAGLWAAGMLGGLVAGVVIALLWLLIFRDPPPDPRVTSRVAHIEQRLAVIHGDLEAALRLAHRIEELEQRMESAAASMSELQLRLTALNERSDRFEAMLEPLRTLNQTVAEIGGELTQLQAGVVELASRVQAVAESVGQVGGPPSRAELGAEIGTLSEAQAALATRLQTLELAVKERDAVLAELRRSFNAVEARTRELEASAATLTQALGQRTAHLAAELTARLAELREELLARSGELERQLSGLRETRAGDFDLLLAASEIAAAALEGRTYAAPFERLVRIAGDVHELSDVLPALAPFAAEGIPTPSALRAELERRAPAILGDMAPSDSDLLAQTWRNLERLLIVRRRDEPPREPEAALEAARHSLAAGDLKAAAQSLQPLAKAGNAAAREWLELVEARELAREAVDRLVAYARERLMAASAN